MADGTAGSTQMDVDGAETNQGGHGNMASHSRASCLVPQDPPRAVQVHPPASTTVKNRRRRYLDIHPEYFGSGLELSDPLLYDRLIRRWQTAAERQDAGRSRDYAEVLETGFMRAELRMEGIQREETRRQQHQVRAQPQERGAAAPSDELPVSRASHSVIDIFDEEAEEELYPVQTREQALELWRETMSSRFVSGRDALFKRYKEVDADEGLDHVKWKDDEEQWFEAEEPNWVGNESEGDSEDVTIERVLHGETGVQDF